MMNFSIRGENIEVTPAIREYLYKKIGKIERLFCESTEAHVHVKMRVNPDKTSKVEITIPFPKFLLRAESVDEDMYAVIDLSVDKLERQIRKHKTKEAKKQRAVQNQKMIASNGYGSTTSTIVVEEEKDTELDIVRTKRFDLKPMTSEEAVLQMNLLGHNFFIYTDAETALTNIVYQRKDGKYGLIETE